MPIVVAPSFDWTQFNLKLAQFRCRELDEEMERRVSEEDQRINAENHLNDAALSVIPRELREMHRRTTETWVERTYEIYCGVWHRQGRTESAELLDAIKKDVLNPLIESRINAVKEQFEVYGAQTRNPRPSSFFMNQLNGFRGDMRALEKHWTRRLQIEALEIEIAKAAVPKHETSNLHQDTELRSKVIAKVENPSSSPVLTTPESDVGNLQPNPLDAKSAERLNTSPEPGKESQAKRRQELAQKIEDKTRLHITIAEAAEIFDVCERTIRNWIIGGRLRAGAKRGTVTTKSMRLLSRSAQRRPKSDP